MVSKEQKRRGHGPVVKNWLKMTAIAILGVAGTAAWAAPATDIPAIAHRVDDRYNHLQTLQAQFTETYRGAGADRTESGTIWLKKPGKMRWEYRSPKEKLFVSDGKNAWFYVPGDQQVRRSKVRDLDDLRSPLAFLLGKTKLEKELQGLSIASDVKPQVPGDVVLRGVPKAMADQVTEVQLEVAPDGRMDRITLFGTDGSSTSYRFENQRQNVEVAESQFKFETPPGVEVIDDSLGQ
jgi:outer membrane lipoprotein carrier protein